MCRGVAVLELTAQVTDVQLVQMWVCDLVMSRQLFSCDLSGKDEDVWQPIRLCIANTGLRLLMMFPASWR